MNHYFIYNFKCFSILFFILLSLLTGCFTQKESENNDKQYMNDNILPIITDCQINYFDKENSGMVLFTGDAMDVDGEIVSYIWEISDGFKCHNSSFTYSFEKTGLFNATFTVIDNKGGIDSKNISFQIYNID